MIHGGDPVCLVTFGGAVQARRVAVQGQQRIDHAIGRSFVGQRLSTKREWVGGW